MLTVKTDKQYLNRIVPFKEELKKKKIVYFFSEINVEEFSFGETDDGVVIQYMFDRIPQKKKYTYKDIKRCRVVSDGYLIWFKDKMFVFIPVGENDDYNMELLVLGEILKENCGDLHFYVETRLKLPVEDGEKATDYGKPKHKKKYVKVSFDPIDSPVRMIVIAVLGVIIAFIFVLMPKEFAPIPVDEAEVYKGTYSYYDIRYHSKRTEYIDIYLEDGNRYELHHRCVTDSVTDKLQTLSRGDEIIIKVNPGHGYIIEIENDSEMILDADYAQKQMKNESMGFFWLGIFLWCAAAFLIVYAVITIIKEKKE